MVKLARVLSRLNSTKILVIGDLLLDSYTIGKARRISPEAPVAVVLVNHEEYRPGGAGNVVLNLLSLGSQVTLLGRIGKDWAGESLCQSFKGEGVDTQFLFIQEGYKTPVKNRIIADNQQIVRIDHEQITALPEQLEQTIIDALPVIMKDAMIVAISDYAKGFLTPTLLKAIIDEARNRGIRIVTDPKGHDFSKYSGSTVLKPNLSEACAAANLPAHSPLELIASRILGATHAKMLMVTRSEAGISLFEDDGKRSDFPVAAKQVKDVTGAGDTVLAMLTYALANDLTYGEAAQLCNVAAGIAIERIGCARITLTDLAQRLLEQNSENKVFDEDHLFALQEVLKNKPFNLLTLQNVNEMTHGVFQTIKNLVQSKVSLLIYIANPELNDGFVDILTSLKEVDFILVHEESLRKLCSSASPVESYLYDGMSLIKN